jgi:hypothetical protein
MKSLGCRVTKYAVLAKFKPHQYGNLAKHELPVHLYFISLVRCSNKRPLEVRIIDLLQFSVDKYYHRDCASVFISFMYWIYCDCRSLNDVISSLNLAGL